MKYKLTDNKKNGLFQIQALIDIPRFDVKKGDLGGFIASEANLSHDGDAWVYENAQVYENARVSENARVFGNARVYGDACVYGNARVYGDACVYGNARVSGNAWVYGNAWVRGNVVIKKTKDYLCIGPVGDNRHITITKNNGMVAAGCAHLSLDDFKKAVDEKYNGEGDYYFWIDGIKKYLI